MNRIKIQTLMKATIVILLLAFGVWLHGQSMKQGATLKSRQLGETADYCKSLGGIAFLENRGDKLEVRCGKFNIQIDGSEKKVEFVPTQEGTQSI